MALCKEMDTVKRSNGEAFDRITRTGALVRYEGIYRCVTCPAEIVGVGGRTLGGGQFRHIRGCTETRWQLVVAVRD